MQSIVRFLLTCAVFAEFTSFYSNERGSARRILLDEAALAGDGDRWCHMNYSLSSSRLSRLDGGVGLLSLRVVYNTAYAGDVCRLLEGELP